MMLGAASIFVADEIGKICSETSSSFVALRPRPVKDPAFAFSHDQDPQQTCAILLRAQSLDYIARLNEEELRDGQGKCSRGLEVDHQIHLGRSFDRDLG